jgi:GTP pyrophosphokinase
LPGDEIVATFSPGKGIVVHRQECRNIGEFKKTGINWLDVEWEKGSTSDFSTEIKVEVGNQRGVLATVASAISEMGSNIENVGMKERDGLTSTLQFVMTVKDRRHLANIMRRLRAIPTVLRIART